MTPTREDILYLAKLAEQAERYEEMVKNMKLIAAMNQELSVEERNVISVAYKNVIGSRRTSWRIVSGVEQKEESRGRRSIVQMVKAYRKKIEDELAVICEDCVDVLEKHVIPSAVSNESKVFFYKMKGDYHRYLAEFTLGDKKIYNTEKAGEAYEAALAVPPLPPTHPIRLGLALNYAVFHYEIINKPERACEIAKQALDDAIAELETPAEESYRDSTLFVQLLRDNLSLWTMDMADTEAERKEAEAAANAANGDD